MRGSLFLFLLFTIVFDFSVGASPVGAFAKDLSSLLKWTRVSSPKSPQNDENVLQFEDGYLVETIVEGDKLGVVPYTIRVSPEGELFAVDSVNSNIVRITPPLSPYSRARLVAGSFQGYSGHVDGKPSDARFNHPKGVTMDDKGNVYVADTSNLAIRKIGEAGVTTIAGGKSNVAGYRDGPSEDAKFSSDFDVVYVGSTCSLLVVDRGNAALRQISLQQEDCDYQYSSVSVSDIIMVVGAVLVGYVSGLLQNGFQGSFFPKMKTAPESSYHQDKATTEKPTLRVEILKEDLDAGWPSFGILLSDLSKFAAEALGSGLLYLIPLSLIPGRSKKGLTPLKDSLVMPEDKANQPTVQKQRISPSLSETLHAPNAGSNYTPPKPQKNSKTPVFKDPTLSTKHRSSKRQDYAEFYGPGEGPQVSAKSQKERTRHRHRDKSGEVVFGATGTEKPVEVKSVVDYTDANFDHFRSKYGSDEVFRF